MGSSRMELGMQGFVAQTIDMYRSGFDSRRMLLQVRAHHTGVFFEGLGF
jgi:hypothetical protein